MAKYGQCYQQFPISCLNSDSGRLHVFTCCIISVELPTCLQQLSDSKTFLDAGRYVLPVVHYLVNCPACDQTAVLRTYVWKHVSSIMYRHLHKPSHIFHRGSKSKICLVFWYHLHSERCDLKTAKSKTIVYSTNVCALICRRPIQYSAKIKTDSEQDAPGSWQSLMVALKNNIPNVQNIKYISWKHLKNTRNLESRPCGLSAWNERKH